VIPARDGDRGCPAIMPGAILAGSAVTSGGGAAMTLKRASAMTLHGTGLLARVPRDDARAGRERR